MYVCIYAHTNMYIAYRLCKEPHRSSSFVFARSIWSFCRWSRRSGCRHSERPAAGRCFGFSCRMMLYRSFGDRFLNQCNFKRSHTCSKSFCALLLETQKTANFVEAIAFSFRSKKSILWQEAGSKLGLLMQDMLLDTFPERCILMAGPCLSLPAIKSKAGLCAPWRLRPLTAQSPNQGSGGF